MDSFAVIGYVFGILGLVAFIRVEKLIKTLKLSKPPEDLPVELRGHYGKKGKIKINLNLQIY